MQSRRTPTNYANSRSYLPEDSATQQGVRQRLRISDEEKRLLPGTHRAGTHAIPIAVPADEWKTGHTTPPSHMKRKAGRGGYRPMNTLNKPSFQSTSKPQSARSALPLDTQVVVGDNVPGYGTSPYFQDDTPKKRQKLSHSARDLEPPGNEHLLPNDFSFDREVVSPPTLRTRQPSAISIHSQDSTTPSRSRSYFTPHEARDVHGVLVQPKRKGRKPRMSSASSSQVDMLDVEVVEVHDSQPSQRTTAMSPPKSKNIHQTPEHVSGKRGSVDDGVSVVIESRQQSSKRQSAASPRPARRLSRPAIEILSARDTLAALSRVDESRSLQETEPSSPPTPAADSSQHEQLSKIFRRDEAGMSSSHGKLRTKMQSSSQAPNHISIVEGSEDELALSSPPPKARGTKALRERGSSPNDIKPTPFTASSGASSRYKERINRHENESQAGMMEQFELASLTTLSTDVSGEDLRLYYIPAERSFIVKHGDLSALKSTQTPPYRILGKHAQIITVNPDESLRLGLHGSKDDVTGGEIWFKFRTLKDLKHCLTRIVEMRGPKAEIKLSKNVENAFDTASSKFQFERKRLNSGRTPANNPEIIIPVNQQSNKLQSPTMTMRKRMQDFQSNDNRTDVDALGWPTASHRRTPQKDSDTRNAQRPEIGNESSQGALAPSPGRSTRASRRLQDTSVHNMQEERAPERWTQKNPPLKWESPLVYPFDGPKRTTVEVTDIERLDDGEFFNDNIISFCLRYLEQSHPELKDKVHIFNTFFYTALSTKQGKRSFNYDAVKRWTKNIDIFSFPFVVVPVNVNLHWFVTIICNLDRLARKVTDEDENEGAKKQESNVSGDDGIEDELPMELPDSQEEQKTESVRAEVNKLSISESEGQEGSGANQAGDRENGAKLAADKIPDSAGTSSQASQAVARKRKKRAAPPLPRLDPKQPAIITLDSLGVSHGVEIRNLKDYVVHEGKEKRGMSISRDEIRGLQAKGIPEQTNFCDCGVYLVGYIEEFLKNPTEFARKVFSRELDKNQDFADFDPARKRVEIRNKLLELEKEQREAKRQRKKAEREAKLAAQRQLDSLTDGSKATNTTARVTGTAPAAPGSSDGELSVSSKQGSSEGPNDSRNQDGSDLLAGIHEAAKS